MSVDVVCLDPHALADRAFPIGEDGSDVALSPLEASLLRADHPFLRVGSWRAFSATRRGRPVARLVASIDGRQRADGRPVGAVGFIAGRDTEALISAMETAISWLATTGVGVVRCPVQLSTWFGHRAVLDGFPEAGGAPWFVMEPRNSPALADAIRATGFVEAHRAVSYLVDHERAIARNQRGLARLHRAGFHDRPLDLTRPVDELRRLHRLSSAIFAGAWGYSELSFEEFAALYEPLLGTVDPRLLRIVESSDGEAVGFVFGVMDPGMGTKPSLDRTNDECRLVVKTIGVLPGVRRRWPGVGSALVAIVHEVARGLGSVGGIHALMAEGSSAHRASTKWGTSFRTYATFEKVTGERGTGARTPRKGTR